MLQIHLQYERFPRELVQHSDVGRPTAVGELDNFYSACELHLQERYSNSNYIAMHEWLVEYGNAVCLLPLLGVHAQVVHHDRKAGEVMLQRRHGVEALGEEGPRHGQHQRGQGQA